MGGTTSTITACGTNGGSWRAGSHSSWRSGHEDSATSQSSVLHHHPGFFTTKPSSLGMGLDSLTPVVSTSTSTMPSTTTSASRSKLFGLATLRRKVMAIPSKMRKAAGGLGRSQSREHARTIRALLSNWSVHEIHALVEEYETLMTIRDLTIEAEIARHVAPSVSEDLARLFDLKLFTDAELVFKNSIFPVHKAILSVRCRYFRDLFSSTFSSVYVITLTPHLADLSISLFSSLLRFLYCGELKTEAAIVGDESSADGEASPNAEGDLAILARLADAFGTPNPLEVDLQSLFCHGLNSDAMLVFTSSCDNSSTVSMSSAGGFSTEDVGGVVAPSSPPSRRVTTATTAPSTPTQPKFFLNLHSPPVSPSSTNRSSVTSPSGAGADSSTATSPLGGAAPTPLVSQPIALLCHRAILSVRSPFFKSIITRRLKSKEEANEDCDILQMILDEKVIPRKYASIIMEAIYTDKVDLGKISSASPAGGCSHVSGVVHPPSPVAGSGGGVVSNSLKEATAISTGKGQHSSLDDAMELYQIGQFLDLEILSQQCEDIIVSYLSLENILKILSWSSEPHGSDWVKRQCLRFLREEFANVANASPPTTLMELSEADMLTLLESDFLQASEQDILGAVLKWSEHQLIRRVEEREPNLVSGTTHSVTRRGLRRRDVNDAELRDIASPLMALVRIAHVLPPNSDTLQLAQRRGLLASPPAHLFGPDSSSASPASQPPYVVPGHSGSGGVYAPGAGVFTGSYHPHHPHHQLSHLPHVYGHAQHTSPSPEATDGNSCGDLVPSAAGRLHSTMNAIAPRCYGGSGRAISSTSSTSTTHHAKTTPPNHPANNATAASNAISSSSAAWLARFPRFPPSANGGGIRGGGGGGRGVVYRNQNPLVETVVPLRPRLFFPYFDEAKSVLQEQLVDLQEDLEVVRLRMLRCCMSHHFPDTLYMVSPMMGNPDATKSMDSNTLSRMDSCEPGVVANSELFIPESDVMLKLLNRMMTLNLHPLTQRALSMMTGALGNVHCANAVAASASGGTRTSSSTGRNSVFNLLQLRAIRECGLPDQVIHVLKTPALFYPDDANVLEASKQLNSLISAPHRREGPPGWGPLTSNTESRACEARSSRSGGVDFPSAGSARTSYVDAAHASISPSSSSCPERVPADFPASLLDPWREGVDHAVVSGDNCAEQFHHHQQLHYHQHRDRPRHRSSSQIPADVIECEEDVNRLEGAVGGADLFSYGAVPDLTMGTSSSRPCSIEVVSTGTSTSPGPSSPEPQQSTGSSYSQGSMNRFHITHFGGLMPPSTSTSENSQEGAPDSIVNVPSNQVKDRKEEESKSFRCDASTDGSFSLSYYQPSHSFLPVTPQAPISPRHQFHHHQHTCNHHANPNLLIPSSNCLSRMNRTSGSDISICAVSTSCSSSRPSPSVAAPPRFPPDIAVAVNPLAASPSASTTPVQLSTPSSMHPPPLDILPSSYHAQPYGNHHSRSNCSMRGPSPDIQNHRPLADYEGASGGPQFPSASSHLSLALNLGGCVGEEHAIASSEGSNHIRGRAQQRRTRGSSGSPTDGGGNGSSVEPSSSASGVHFFERTSVSLVRRAPSQRRPEEVEEEVTMDEEGLFV